MMNQMSVPTALARLVEDLSRPLHSFGSYHDRSVSPGQTFAAIEPFFPELGITRVGLLTGLDTLNIPVAFATRPNSYTLSVFQGKGIDKEAAMTSAAMEAVETKIAEIAPARMRWASRHALEAGGENIIDLASTARCVPSEITEAALPWVTGLDICSDRPINVPWWLVGLDHRGKRPPGFEQSSDGLASGNTPAEALLHGLCELVERDAWTLLQLATVEQLRERLIDPATIDDAVVNIMIERTRNAGMRIVLVDMTTDTGVPAFLAVLVPQGSGDRMDAQWSQICGGCGCHPDPIRAILRAITEAAQSRLTAIAGSRDDFSPKIYQRLGNDDALKFIVDFANIQGKAFRHFEELSATATIDCKIKHIVGRLKARGIRQVVVVPMQDAGLPVSVVRVIVPGLEVELLGDYIQLGLRAATMLKETSH